MIFFDGIIEHLQRTGGVSVVFREFIKRIGSKESFIYQSYVEKSQVSPSFLIKKPRFLERYRDCKLDTTEVVGKVAIFHSTYYRLPRDKNRYKIVTTVHDFTYEKYASGLKKWVHCYQKYRAIKNSDIIICVSNSTANDLMEYCPVDASKVKVVYNGVSEAYFPLTRKSNENKILFVGSRAGYKNFSSAVIAVSLISEKKLYIVGGGRLLNDEKKMLEKYLPGRYVFLGFLSDEELNLEYNSSYALLYPSSYEGFGIPIIEAMKAGCPVVAMRSSSIPEVAGNAAILTNSASPDEFAEALRLIAFKRNELRVAGFKQSGKFSWDKTFNNTLDVYHNLIK